MMALKTSDGNFADIPNRLEMVSRLGMITEYVHHKQGPQVIYHLEPDSILACCS